MEQPEQQVKSKQTINILEGRLFSSKSVMNQVGAIKEKICTKGSQHLLYNQALDFNSKTYPHSSSESSS